MTGNIITSSDMQEQETVVLEAIEKDFNEKKYHEVFIHIRYYIGHVHYRGYDNTTGIIGRLFHNAIIDIEQNTNHLTQLTHHLISDINHGITIPKTSAERAGYAPLPISFKNETNIEIEIKELTNILQRYENKEYNEMYLCLMRNIGWAPHYEPHEGIVERALDNFFAVMEKKANGQYDEKHDQFSGFINHLINDLKLNKKYGYI